jgi:hypothetical protein
MNLVEITLLINSPTIPDDMREYYINQRRELVKEINNDIDGRDFSLRELLLLSPRPDLADTI